VNARAKITVFPAAGGTFEIVQPRPEPRRLVVRNLAGACAFAHDAAEIENARGQIPVTGDLYLIPALGADVFIVAPGQGLYGFAIGFAVVSVEEHEGIPYSDTVLLI
jgi:hypothetical protein